MKELAKYTYLVLCVALVALPASAQQNQEDEEAAYTRAINKRAEKIVNTLSLTDAGKAARVQQAIASQYRNLSEIHDTRDAEIEQVKDDTSDKKKAEKKITSVKRKADKKLDKLHKQYLAALAETLNEEQIDKVKDGMTYNVAPNTYRVYLDMLPSLTGEQKDQILAWLVEAREHAMDAGSSEKKHWWFGKYKGKINNYLSAAGYDMKQAEAEWRKRKEAGKS